MNYIKISENDIANGSGIRTTLWVSGCNHNCYGCQNPQTWDSSNGKKFTDSDMLLLLYSLSYSWVRGLTLSGGDPLYPKNRDKILEIVKTVKSTFPQKDIWMWTGYLWEEIKHLELIKYIDVLVDGPFIIDKKNISLKWRGSENQRVINVKESLLKERVVIFYD